MTHSYQITGMTCQKCVAKAKNELLKLGDISEVEVQLAAPQATLTMQRHVSVAQLQSALSKAGNYIISEDNHADSSGSHQETDLSWFQTYRPIFFIGLYLMGITILAESAHDTFDTHRWMSHFMAGFFLTFSFFKFLDLKAFADSYATYDIIARNWRGWGYVYAFFELLAGVAFLTRFDPLLTNAIVFGVMSLSIIGVIQSVMNKRKIRCACLGAVFNLPMSSITIIEDALMMAMSAFMIISLL